MTAKDLKRKSNKHRVVNAGPWTRFMDMHSGGRCKEDPFEYIYIQADEESAKSIFYGLFGHSPDRVTCTCCGNDYSSDEEPTLGLSTAYNREATFDRAKNDYDERTGYALAGYVKRTDVLVIYRDMFDAKLASTEVPRQGYVWVDE